MDHAAGRICRFLPGEMSGYPDGFRAERSLLRTWPVEERWQSRESRNARSRVPLGDRKYARAAAGGGLVRHGGIRRAEIDTDAVLRDGHSRGLLHAHLKLDFPSPVGGGVFHPEFQVAEFGDDRIDLHG